MCFIVEIFFESGALEAFIRLFNQDDCPDHQHALETILTLSSAKANCLLEQDPVLLEKLRENLKKRLDSLGDSEDHEVSLLRV